MADFIWTVKQNYEAVKATHADPRTKDWFLLEDSPFPIWILTLAYILFVAFGPGLMKKRKPFGLKWFMLTYNLGLVILSMYMFVEIILSTWNAGYDYTCAVYNKKSQTNPKETRVARVLWWYFFSKAIELMDTVLMILRKKNDQITFLHVFHHATMLNIWWWVMMFIPGGLSWFGACLNCLIHVLMYSYYGLSVIPSLKGKLWWKRYITSSQLVQFCITFIHTMNSIYTSCDFPKWGQCLLAGYMIVMMILFSNFYIQAYIKGKRDPNLRQHLPNKKLCSNGEINGVIKKSL